MKPVRASRVRLVAVMAEEVETAQAAVMVVAVAAAQAVAAAVAIAGASPAGKKAGKKIDLKNNGKRRISFGAFCFKSTQCAA
jgi:hypothetical protein